MVRSSSTISENAFNHGSSLFGPIYKYLFLKSTPKIQIKEIIKYVVLFVRTYASARLLFANPSEVYWYNLLKLLLWNKNNSSGVIRGIVKDVEICEKNGKNQKMYFKPSCIYFCYLFTAILQIMSEKLILWGRTISGQCLFHERQEDET